ncbi:MAG: DUF2147 domain-containing protein [Candidatus Margulisbacteria bacterium]|nr:DUF2147 domain-containing protein [Candidatus Margulisiibacteriota bacterium]
MQIIKYLLLFGLISLSLSVVDADSILGKWYTVSENSQIEIYKNNTEYKGKIVWLKNPYFGERYPDKIGKPKTDVMNPDLKKQDQPLLGLELLNGFHFNDNDKRWVDGTIYNPEDGKNYYCNMQLENKDILRVRGSLDAWGFLGKTQVWSRVKE